MDEDVTHGHLPDVRGIDPASLVNESSAKTGLDLILASNVARLNGFNASIGAD
jgi:hypothetical protein